MTLCVKLRPDINPTFTQAHALFYIYIIVHLFTLVACISNYNAIVSDLTVQSSLTRSKNIPEHYGLQATQYIRR